MKNIRIKTKQHIKITFQIACLLFFRGMKECWYWTTAETIHKHESDGYVCTFVCIDSIDHQINFWTTILIAWYLHFGRECKPYYSCFRTTLLHLSSFFFARTPRFPNEFLLTDANKFEMSLNPWLGLALMTAFAFLYCFLH